MHLCSCKIQLFLQTILYTYVCREYIGQINKNNIYKARTSRLIYNFYFI